MGEIRHLTFEESGADLDGIRRWPKGDVIRNSLLVNPITSLLVACDK